MPILHAQFAGKLSQNLEKAIELTHSVSQTRSQKLIVSFNIESPQRFLSRKSEAILSPRSNSLDGFMQILDIPQSNSDSKGRYAEPRVNVTETPILSR
jgi:hypothetical protein